MEHLIQKRLEKKRRNLRENIKKNVHNILRRLGSPHNHGNFDANAFQKLEVNGIWGQVLSWLDNKSDITSASSTCPRFAKYLESRRTLSTFPEVLKILVQRKYLRYDPENDQSSRRDLLTLRLVSSKVKGIVDYHIFQYVNLQNTMLWRSWTTDPTICVFDSQQQNLDKVFTLLDTKYLNLNDSSLLYSIGLFLEDCEGDGVINCQEKFTKLLEIHGSTTKRFVYQNERQVSFREWYKSLWESVRFMPNLRSLIILQPNGAILRSFLSRVNAFVEEESSLEAEQAVLEYPFPTISSLEHLTFRHDCKNDEFLTSIFVEILQKNRNIKSLQFASQTFENEEVTNALKSLNLERFFFGGDFTEACFILERVHFPNLKFIKLCNTSPVSSSEVFALAERFKDSLVELKLSAFQMREDGSKLTLPKLKYLGICMHDEDFKSLDPFIGLENMERLTVEVDLYGGCEDANETDGEVIQFLGSIKNLETSNVWKIFPHLSYIDIHYRSEMEYSRITYTKQGLDVSKLIVMEID